MPDFSKALDTASVELTLFEWMTVHGNVCLGLRHPQNDGPHREYALTALARIERVLLEGGLLNAADIEEVHRVEREAAGSEGTVS